MKTTLYSLSPIRTILIKAPLSITFKEAGTFTKTAISPFFVFHWIIRRKKSLLSGLKCNGFIKIALSGFRP